MSIRTTFDRLIAAREREARRHVNRALLGMDDATLRAAGYDRETLRRNASSSLPL